MAINLLSTIQTLIGSELTHQSAGVLGESVTSTGSAVHSVLPALIGGMAQQGSTATGAGELLSAINAPGVNGNIMSQLSGLFGGGASTNALTSAGGSMVSSLFGGKLGGVTSAISAASGVSAGSAGTLLTMAAPLIFGFLKNHAATNNMDAHGLMSLLGGQKDHVAGALDGRVASALGMAPVAPVASTTARVATAASTVTHTATAAVEETTSGIGKFLPWLLGLGAIAAALYYFMGHKEPAPAPVVEPTPAVEPVTPAATPAVTEPAGKVLDLAGGEKITVKAGGFMENFYDAINNKDWDMTKPLRLDNVNFDTGKATVTPDSAEEINDIAAVLKAYPNTAIKMVGATDNVGDAASNKTLSAGRSAAVKAGVVAKGIAADRIATDGIGQDTPVASNDTAEGKAQNRRVDVYLTKK